MADLGTRLKILTAELSDWSFEALSNFGAFIHNWQTLVSGGLATVAAYITVRTMRQQLRVESERHDKRNNRLKMVVRARLPDALSGLIDYVKRAVAFKVKEEGASIGDPEQTIDWLYQAIQHVDDDAAERLFEMVSWYQVWRARLFSGDPRGNNYKSQALYDSALLVAYALSIFDYARNESQTVKTNLPTVEEMTASLSVVFGPVETRMSSNDELLSRVRAHIEALHGQTN